MPCVRGVSISFADHISTTLVVLLVRSLCIIRIIIKNNVTYLLY